MGKHREAKPRHDGESNAGRSYEALGVRRRVREGPQPSQPHDGEAQPKDKPEGAPLGPSAPRKTLGVASHGNCGAEAAESQPSSTALEIGSKPDQDPEEAPISGQDTSRLFSGPVLIALAILFFGAGGLVVFHQGMQIMRHLATLPPFVRWLGYGAAGLLAAAVAGSGGYLAFRFLRLAASPQIALPSLARLDDRASIRAMGNYRDAKPKLMAILEAYPLDGNAASLRRAGLTEEEIGRLRDHRRFLCERFRGSDREWAERLNAGFLAVLDAAARRRIRWYMVQVGVKTAAMPIGFVDAAIVLVNANLMVGDLCTIYNLRTSGLSTAAVLAWAFFNTVAASRLGEFTDEAAESVMKDVEAGLAGAVGGKVLAKASEGTLNALLVGRLGRTAMRRLRPVVLKR